jgi:hypothetical protein
MGKRTVFNLEAAKRQSGTKAQVMEVEYPTSKLPACSWCKKKKLRLQWEYIQQGLWYDDFMLICYCKSCFRTTIIIYQSKEEENEQP